MKISEFKKLEKSIKNINFNHSYKNINVIMAILSYFGNVASIFLAYFFLSKVISGAVENQIAVFLSSIIILAGVELLKRDIFDKFSVQYLKENAFTKAVLPLAITSLLLIFASFYSSLNGAHDFANKSDKIEMQKDTTLQAYSDSLTNLYDGKISLKDKEITDLKNQISSKDKEQTEIESQQPLTRQQRQRVSDLKNEKQTLRLDIQKYEVDIKSFKSERDSLISLKETKLSITSDKQKDNNSENSFLFVIISTIIELMILAGVFFNEYYKFRSYREFRDKIEQDPNYQKWLLYDQMLSIILKDDSKVNQKLPANKAIIEMCKVNDIIILPKDVTDFLKVLAGLGIIKQSGSARYISKTKDVAQEVLRKNFNIE